MQLQQEMILCKTKNLLVRRMLPSDAEDLYLLLSDERVMEYLEPPYSHKAAEAFLEKAGLSDPHRLSMRSATAAKNSSDM